MVVLFLYLLLIYFVCSFNILIVRSIQADKKNILIAPFMANIDLAVAGKVYYRETTDSAELERAVGKIRQYFVRNSEFQPSSMLIVTWDKVGFFGSAAPSVVSFGCGYIQSTHPKFKLYFRHQTSLATLECLTELGFTIV